MFCLYFSFGCRRVNRWINQLLMFEAFCYLRITWYWFIDLWTHENNFTKQRFKDSLNALFRLNQWQVLQSHSLCRWVSGLFTQLIDSFVSLRAGAAFAAVIKHLAGSAVLDIGLSLVTLVEFLLVSRVREESVLLASTEARSCGASTGLLAWCDCRWGVRLSFAGWGEKLKRLTKGKTFTCLFPDDMWFTHTRLSS